MLHITHKIFYYPLLIFLLVIPLLFSSLTIAAQQSVHPERLSLDQGWRFFLGDVPFPVVKGHGMSYFNAKAGRAGGAAAPDYDDSEWRVLDLPHDWAVEQSFDSTANVSQGYRQRGIGWYRRNFKVDSSDRGKNLELQFEGIATHCTIWLNGTVIHRNWSGYTSFYLDISALVKYGNEINNIAIRVDANDQEGWWYEGAGIYRHTWLVKRSPVHITTDGVFAQPVKIKGRKWALPVEVTLANSGPSLSPFTVEVALFDMKGIKIASRRAQAIIGGYKSCAIKVAIPVSNPVLWSVKNPTLYKIKTLIIKNRVINDSLVTICGFRSIRFDADSGFYLNGRHLKIKGVCCHQDHAGVGVAVPEALWTFRIKKLKEMGANAIRCAHNPPSAGFLEACDKAGMLVMDENRNFNSSPEYLGQLQWMIRRDRNHPSVILWSVFNEEPMQGTEIGYKMVSRMNAAVKELDTTRPITAAANGGLFSVQNVTQAVDVVGFNYQMSAYDTFHRAHPTMKLTSSEDACGLMTRGEYKTNLHKNVLAAYDNEWSPWGANHRNAWKEIAQRPFMAGCFVWAGFDYRGEPQPFEWPSASSSFGIMDLCGFPKTAFYIHQAQWAEGQNVLHLVPHWNWPADSLGKNIQVMALSNAEHLRLFLNGKLIKEEPVNKYEMNTWKVPYQPGKLEVVGLRGKKEVSRFAVETTGKPAQLQLIPERRYLKGDGWDAMPVTVRVLDAGGKPVENTNILVSFKLTGAGSIIGLGNGDPNSHEPEKGSQRHLYNGLAQVILQSRPGSCGHLTLTASAEGLQDAVTDLDLREALQIPYVAVVPPVMILGNWKMSPMYKECPDISQEIADYDMNTWVPFNPGQLQRFSNGRFIVFQTNFTPFKKQQKLGCQMNLRNVAGKAQIYLDKRILSEKNDSKRMDWSINVPPGEGPRSLIIVIEAKQNQEAGLGGLIDLHE